VACKLTTKTIITLALAVVAIVMSVLAIRASIRALGAGEFAGVMTTPPPAAPDTQRKPRDPFGALLRGEATAAEQLTAPHNAQPLDGAPAGLATPPGAERMMAFQRRDDAGLNQFAVYRVPADADQPAAHTLRPYIASAQERGFELRRSIHEGAELGRDADGALLQLSARRVGEHVRVTIVAHHPARP